ncbi:MAG: C25 family cysteine peptidase, partial [Rubricoccaceae bacterium]|nr:C25 family cysteine peptidase [Rubricoccaceae bacterium]
EELLIDAESGAIAHWGSSELGTISNSRALADLLFEELYPDTSRTLGLAVQATKNAFNAGVSGEWARRHMLQYNLIGDPGIRLVIPDKPDLHISEQLASFEPQIPLTADSTVYLNLDLRNRGYYTSDSLTVSVLHTGPDGSQRTYDFRIEEFAVSDSLSLPIPIRDLAGEHTYAVSVDPLNEYEEMREDNNMTTLSHLVFSNGLTVVLPEPYGITDQTPLIRVSIASQVGTSNVPVYFELDTEPTFDSPNLRSSTGTLSNGYADWQIANALSDNGVYFWRATIEDPQDPDAKWTNSSFSVSTEHAGTYAFMQQAPLWQDNDDNIRLEWTEEDGWKFVPYTVSVFANSDRAGETVYRGRFQINGQNYLDNTAGFGLIVLDGVRGTVKAFTEAVTYENPFGHNPATALNRLQQTAAQIEEGDYFFIRTRHLLNLGPPEIAEAVKDVFRDIGMVAIDTLTYDHLWLAKGQLGNPEYTEEWVVPPEEDVPDISWTHKLVFTYPEGETTSPEIGPAQAWGSFQSSFELPDPDSYVVFDVLSREGTVLIDSVDASKPVDIGSISALEHPYLRIRATLSDTSRTGTPQLENLLVGYTPVADLVVDAEASSFPEEAFQEGSPDNTATLVVRNIGAQASTPTEIFARHTDPENNTEIIGTESVGIIQPGETRSATFELPSLGIVGTNLLFTQATQTNVTERIAYNNVLLQPFEVFADNTRPVMEVTVDGLALPNAPGVVLDLQSAELPFVSAQPTIEVVVNDENPYLPLDDPSVFQLALDRLPLSPNQFSFIPATPENNEARIIFEPDLAGIDTVHTFTVRAVDATGNYALVDPTVEDSTLYQVHFRVQNELVIESLYPYPNPMSRRTRLMFRMGGESSTLVSDFRIRIYTISGRLVREFDLIRDPTLLERGSLQIGWNSVPWDGTDEDGDPVASGVYLYKVFVTDTDGQDHAINNPDSIDRIALIR